MRSFLLTISILLFSYLSLKAQDITGLWEVKSVSVGEQSMTPVGKWFRIEADGSYTGGNGWLQNSKGTYVYSEQEKTYRPKETNGITDPAGAFTVAFTATGMQWSREEEGMPVTVQLAQIEELPKAPADQIVGLWGLKQVSENGQDITATFDPNQQHFRFFRWDRLYNERNAAGERKSGYWHMNAHKPEITLLPHEAGKEPESWRVEVSDNTLILAGISDSNQGKTMQYSRLSEFPK